MITLLGDANIQGHVRLLTARMQSEDWREFWDYLQLRCGNTPHSLPVFTIANPRGVLSGHEYAERVIDRLFRYLLELDSIRGTGRLFLP